MFAENRRYGRLLFSVTISFPFLMVVWPKLSARLYLEAIRQTSTNKTQSPHPFSESTVEAKLSRKKVSVAGQNQIALHISWTLSI